MKHISCGVVISDKKSLLIGHVTNGQYWDIPKGQLDKNESYVECAIRELHEETGLTVQENMLISLGMFEYRPKKSLVLFYYPVDVFPSVDTLVCHSFVTKNKSSFPELDDFKIEEFTVAINLLNPKLGKVIDKVRELIQNG